MYFDATGITGELARFVQCQLLCQTIVAIKFVLWLDKVFFCPDYQDHS
jgi:hypothetical protein